MPQIPNSRKFILVMPGRRVDSPEPALTLGLVREQDAGIQAFLSHDGFSVLMRGMQSEHEKLRTKSAFLLLNLLTSHPEHKGKLRGDAMANPSPVLKLHHLRKDV